MSSNHNDSSRQIALAEAKNDLACLIGMERAKESLTEIERFARTQAARRKQGYPTHSIGLNLVMTGPPGVGKSTLARIIARLLYGYGILRTGAFFETSRGTLVKGWIGQSEEKTMTYLKQSLGGVLFIDEAPNLAKPESEKDYGKDIIEVLNYFMEKHRDDLVVIVAGYADKMDEFFSMNAGLKSRFDWPIDLVEYTPHDLCQIFDQLIWDKELTLTPKAKARAALLFHTMWATGATKDENGRSARKVCQAAWKRHGSMLNGQISAKTVNTLSEKHVPLESYLQFLDFEKAESILRWKARCASCNFQIVFPVEALASESRCKCGALLTLPWWSIDFVSAGQQFSQLMADADHKFVPATAHVSVPRPRRQAKEVEDSEPVDTIPTRSRRDEPIVETSGDAPVRDEIPRQTPRQTPPKRWSSSLGGFVATFAAIVFCVIFLFAVGIFPVSIGDIALGRVCATLAIVNVLIVLLWVAFRPRQPFSTGDSGDG